uniref:glutathione transferase n=1 Tax=Astyanax mexicanus TaxID=7994 RepID=A0A8B9HDU1_ASTMX
MFHQVPLIEMDGMKMVQTKAILNYIAGKYNLYGKDLKERLMIDTYAEGARDIMDLIMGVPFTPPEKKQSTLNNLETKAKVRSLPAYEKALSSSQYLVGNQLSCADVSLFEVALMLEELFPTILSTFPNIQVRITNLPDWLLAATSGRRIIEGLTVLLYFPALFITEFKWVLTRS